MSSGSEHSSGDKDKAISSHHFTSGPQMALSNQPTVSVTETEEWTTRKKKDTVITKQIETRVKREIVVNDDGEVTEDSGPQIITDVTHNTKTETEEDFKHSVSGSNKPGEKWSLLPSSVVVSDVKHTKNSKNETREEKTETAVTEEVDGITREEIMRAIKQRDRDALKSKHSSSNDSSSSSLKMSDSRSSLDKSDVNVFQFKGQQFNNNNGDGMNQVEEDHFKRLQSEWNHLEKSRTTSPTFFNGASVRDKTDKEIRLESPSRSHSSLSFYVGDTTDNFGGHNSRTSNKIETDHSSRGLFSSDKYKMTNREWNHVDDNHLEDVTLADDVRSRSFTSNALNKSQHRQDLADDRDHSTLTKVHHHRRQQQLPERSFQFSDYDSHQSHKSDEPKIEVSVGEVSFNGFKVSPSSTRTAHNIPLKGILKESFSEQKKFVSDHRTENEESRVTIIPSSLGKQQHFQRFDDLHLGERSSNFQTIPFNDTCIVHSRDKISIKNNGSISPERNLNNQYVLTISISSDGTIGNSFLNNGVNRRSTS